MLSIRHKQYKCQVFFLFLPISDHIMSGNPNFVHHYILITMAIEKVILVDERDRQTGTMEKIEAHEKALLHRAFSIFIFNDRGEMMLQKRSLSKYHSPGLWTNACCSHPRPGESLKEATRRRILEEMGFQCKMNEVFSFIYKAAFDHGLTEHELDHVFFGVYNGAPEINLEEVAEWKWIHIDELLADVKANPDNYTVWFKIALKEMGNKGY